MKIKDQVVRLELAKRLNELGVKQSSYFYWHKGGQKWYVDKSLAGRFPEAKTSISAFTVAELGKMLPDGFHLFKFNQTFRIEYNRDYLKAPMQVDDTEADARAKMLIWLIEKFNWVIDHKKIKKGVL